jgi:hypothetical protein
MQTQTPMNEWQMFLATTGYHLRSTSDPVGILLRIRNDKTFVSELLAGLASHDSASIRASVARHPEVKEEILGLLGSDENIDVRLEVAKNKWTPLDKLLEMADADDPKVLEVLAFSEDEQVRQIVAGNPQCPESVHMQLAMDKMPTVRVAMAENTNCSQHALTLFATSQFFEYRVLAACHLKLSHALFAVLSEDVEIAVRAAVVNNNACPFEIRAPLYAKEPSLLHAIDSTKEEDECNDSEIDQ